MQLLRGDHGRRLHYDAGRKIPTPHTGRQRHHLPLLHRGAPQVIGEAPNVLHGAAGLPSPQPHLHVDPLSESERLCGDAPAPSGHDTAYTGFLHIWISELRVAHSLGP
jgi:hypothetical protein